LVDIQAQLVTRDFFLAVSDLRFFSDLEQDALFELVSPQGRFIARSQKTMVTDFYELWWQYPAWRDKLCKQNLLMNSNYHKIPSSVILFFLLYFTDCGGWIFLAGRAGC
jgi:hypothetical protein